MEAIPSVRFDVFDARGRGQPALLVIVSRARVERLDGSPRAMRVRVAVAIVLFAAAPPLMYYDWTRRGVLVLPTFLALSMILAAFRLLFMNERAP